MRAAWAAADRLFPSGSPVSTRPVVAELSDADKERTKEAKDIIQRVETRMAALVRAASERWKPAQSVFNADETGPLVFSDDEYATFLTMVERLGEVVMLREISMFSGLPQDMVDSVVVDKLRQKLMIAPSNRAGSPVVVKRGQKANDE